MNLLHGLRRANRLYGDRIAIYHQDRTLTYREFQQRVVRAANALRGRGVGKGDRVAVLMLNSPRYLELYYGTAMIGAAIVPLNTRWNLEDIAFALNDSSSMMLVLDDRFAPLEEQLGQRVQGELDCVFAGDGISPDTMADYECLLRAAPAGQGETEPQEDELAGLFYTSGTTGGPKGVMLTHRNLHSNALHGIIETQMSKDTVWLHSAPMFHLANGSMMYGLTMMGAGHAFISEFEPEAFLQAIERYHVTHGLLLPTMLNMVLNHPALSRYDTSSLRFVFYGASPMPLDLLRRGMDHFHCQFAQGYGMTETSPLLTFLGPEDHCFENAQERFAPVKSAGRPMVGVEVRVVDPLDRELPAGETGEIIARGPNVMKGYWNRPEITAEVLRGGWMHTGDLGAFDERGYLYIFDRVKDMIKTGGENVYSPEVESVIYSHPDVLEAAVIGVPDEKWGESILAVVVLREGSKLRESQLIDFCRERLTHFKCPTSVDFADALPKGGSGKIQKDVLRKQYQKRLHS